MVHKLKALTQEGDTVVEWETEDAVQHKEAEAIFEGYQHRGYAAFSGAATETPVQIRKFSETGEETLMIPALQGG